MKYSCSATLLVGRSISINTHKSRFYSTSWPSFPSETKRELFVSGLSWSVDEKSLKDAFSPFGEVKEARLIYDRENGRPRGFGFVYFSKENEAKSARNAMDGKEFFGRRLMINFAIARARGERFTSRGCSHIQDYVNRNMNLREEDAS